MRFRLRGLRHAFWLAALGCSSPDPTPRAVVPEDAGDGCHFPAPVPAFTERPLDMPPAAARRPAPRTIELDLTAAPTLMEYLPGHSTPAFAYNGTVPGPVIEARVGDRLVVHLTNHLAEATTIHWHGVHLPPEMDGTTLLRDPVWPGESFTYSFVLSSAGLYWYHPHLHESRQIERGLYGTLIVREDDGVTAPERLMMIQDLLLDANGALLPDEAILVDANGAARTNSVHTMEMMGRDGNVVAINGRVAPILHVRAGTWERWRIVNPSVARYYALRLDGHTFVQIGTDGGLLERPIMNADVLLTPGERVDLLVYFGAPAGTRVTLRSGQYSRRRYTGGNTSIDIAQVQYDDTPAPATPPPLPAPARLRTIEKLDTSSRPRSFILRESIQGGTTGHGGHGGVASDCTAALPYPGLYVFSINDELYPDVTPVRAALGETQVWDVINQSSGDHPFHVHGFQFQPVTVAGYAAPLQWKDTINVPYGRTVRIAVRFDDFAGPFLYHCHIVQHGAGGRMMGELRVSRPD